MKCRRSVTCVLGLTCYLCPCPLVSREHTLLTLAEGGKVKS